MVVADSRSAIRLSADNRARREARIGTPRREPCGLTRGKGLTVRMALYGVCQCHVLRREGYRGLATLRGGRCPSQPPTDLDRNSGGPPRGHVHRRNVHRDRFVNAGDVGWDPFEQPGRHRVPGVARERDPDARGGGGDPRSEQCRGMALRPIFRNGIGLRRAIDVCPARWGGALASSIFSQRDHRYRRIALASARHRGGDRGCRPTAERHGGRDGQVRGPLVQHDRKRDGDEARRHDWRALPNSSPDRGRFLFTRDGPHPNRGCRLVRAAAGCLIRWELRPRRNPNRSRSFSRSVRPRGVPAEPRAA